MANQTPNYDLTKPLDSEFYDVEVQNGNMDKIDTQMKANADAITTLQNGQSSKADLVDGKVPAAQLPSYVDDVVEYANLAAFPATGETGKIYVALDTNKTYRWSGSAYVEISESLALGETSSTAYAGNKGKAATDAINAHKDKSLLGETGVHGLRYYDNKLQVDDGSGNWSVAGAGGGIGPQVVVSVAAGSLVTCTDGTTTLTDTATSGSVTFDIPNYGTWNIHGTLDGHTTATETLVVDTAKLYNVGLSYFSATLTVTAKTGSVVTVTNGTRTVTQTAANNTAIFSLTVSGTYSVYATYDGVQSNTISVNATTDGGNYTATLAFIVLTVTVDSGSSVTVSKGSVSKQATSTGTAVFYLPSTGTWAVTATLSGQTATDNVTISSYSAYSLTLNYYKYFGIKIQISNSDPASAVTYIDDAVGMSTGHNAWKNTAIFKNIKPCVVKNGVVQYYLNPDNLAYKEDGTSAATINSTTAGDVMIEIPKLGFKMTTDGTYHYIWVTDDPAADGYCYLAHSLDAEGDCDKIYIGAYLGYVNGTNLYSISGQTLKVSTTLTNFRTYAANRGTGYQLVSFYPLTLLQCLYLIKYKNRNGQSALGKGYTSASAKTASGGANARGTDWGETAGTSQMCFLNIEDFWGNLYWWIDGIYCDSSRNIKTAYKNFSDTGANYAYSKSSGLSSDIGNYMSDIQGTNQGGFVAKAVSGSTTTYYADSAHLCAGYYAGFGGSWGSGEGAGPFRFGVSYAASDSSSSLGARLMYKHKAA